MECALGACSRVCGGGGLLPLGLLIDAPQSYEAALKRGSLSFSLPGIARYVYLPASKAFFARAASSDKTFHEWPAAEGLRHEVLNESTGGAVDLVVSWLTQRARGGAAGKK